MMVNDYSVTNDWIVDIDMYARTVGRLRDLVLSFWCFFFDAV